MEWDRYSGFISKGVYVIINKASMTSLDLNEGSSEPGTKVQGFAHSPNNGAQLWKFIKHPKADVYAIQNVRGGLLLTATGVDQELIGEKDPSTKSYPTETLWEVDSSLYSLHPGKMAILRSVGYPSYVIELHNGEIANNTPVRLAKERGISDEREMQKWLLQRQDHI